MIVRKRRAAWVSALCAIAACGSEPRTEVAAPASLVDTSGRTAETEAVTLITGDRVLYSNGPSGPSVHVEPGPGRKAIGFATLRHRDRVLVIPNDVARLVATRQLDRALFDITALVESGYTDRQRDDIPLIVTGGPELFARGVVRDGVVVQRRMPAVQAVAVRQRKTSPGAALAALTSGEATKIWLDRSRRIPMTLPGRAAPALDSAAIAPRREVIPFLASQRTGIDRFGSGPRKGDPRREVIPFLASQRTGIDRFGSGPTGAGVTVAVLSSGIDASHPDLAGKVIAAEDFTEDGQGPGDVLGLGTYVASLIAGSGQASDGVFRGIAPDAHLVSGRVCQMEDIGPFRFFVCLDSAVLAGLEWAAVEQGAKIVDVLFVAEDGPDASPLEEAVERLAAQHGTLFIAGAGDFGEFAQPLLAEPGSTDHALAVGAVDHDGELAARSARGPRSGDGAIKPDLTALGVDAVGARASGVPPIGTEVDDAYQAVSSTDAAAGFVAGAAALLVEQHPDWTGTELKAVLTGTAAPNPALTAFEQGSGQLDIARATRQPVFASLSSVSLGQTRWPHDDDRLIERTVTYRNIGATPVHLALSAALRGPDRQPAPAHMARVAPQEIDVPAGGQVNVVVAIDTNGDALDGRYEGALVALGDDSRIVTPIAVEREIESYDLGIRASDLHGDPAFAFAALIGLDVDTLAFPDIAGGTELRLPRGRYTLLASVGDTLVMAYPRLTLDRSFVAHLDGRAARPIAIEVPGVDPVLRSQELVYLDTTLRLAVRFAALEPMFSAGFGPEADDVHSWAVVSTLDPFDESEPDTVYMFAHRERGQFLTGWSEVIDPRQLARVDARHLGHGASGWRKWATVVLDDMPQFGGIGGNFGFATYPGAFDRTEYYYGRGLRFNLLAFELAATFVATPLNVGDLVRAKRYLPGSRSVETWHRAPFGPAFGDLDGNPATSRTGDVLRISPSLVSDQESPPRRSTTLQAQDRSALYRDGALLVESSGDTFFRPVTVPPGRATYRFERSMSRGTFTRFTGEPLFELSPEVSAAWTFTSGHVDGTAVLPLPTLRFRPVLDANNRTAARLFLLPFVIERPVGAPTPAITDARLEVSFDDGERWSAVPVLRLGDHAIAVFAHPRKAEFVSLRGSASDVAGNRVEQTIIHAYGLGRTED